MFLSAFASTSPSFFPGDLCLHFRLPCLPRCLIFTFPELCLVCVLASAAVSVSDGLGNGLALGLILPVCLSASLLSGGWAVGLWWEQNDSCWWHRGCLQRSHKDSLYLLPSWKLPELTHLNQPSACSVQQLVLARNSHAKGFCRKSWIASLSQMLSVTFTRPSYRSPMTSSVRSSSLVLCRLSTLCKSVQKTWPQRARVLWWEK